MKGEYCLSFRRLSTWLNDWAMGAAILSFLGRPFFLFSTTSPPSNSSSGFLLLNDRFLLMVAILSSLSLLVSSLVLTSFMAETASFGLLYKDTVFQGLFVLVFILVLLKHITYTTPVTCLKVWVQQWRRWQMWPLVWPLTFRWTWSPKLSLVQSWRQTWSTNWTSH